MIQPPTCILHIVQVVHIPGSTLQAAYVVEASVSESLLADGTTLAKLSDDDIRSMISKTKG